VLDQFEETVPVLCFPDRSFASFSMSSHMVELRRDRSAPRRLDARRFPWTAVSLRQPHPDLFNNYYRLKIPDETAVHGDHPAHLRAWPIAASSRRPWTPRRRPRDVSACHAPDTSDGQRCQSVKCSAPDQARSHANRQTDSPALRRLTPARMGLPPPVMRLPASSWCLPYLQIVCYELWSNLPRTKRRSWWTIR